MTGGNSVNAVDQQLNRQALSNIRRITLGSVPSALVMALWLRPYVSSSLSAWAVACITVSAVGQFVSSSAYLREPSRSWLLLTRALVCMSGLGWGLFALFGIPAASTDGGRMRIVVMLCGVLTTSVASSNASPMTFIVYVTPPLTCLITGLVIAGGDRLLLLGIVGFMIVLAESFRASHVVTRSAVALRYEADDLSARLAEALRLTEHDSLHDPLTGAGNRRLLARQSDEKDITETSVICVDLDKFKQLNDQHGHAAGDELLVMVTNRIRTLVRVDDSLIRTGGDEFVVILNSSHGHAEPIAARLVHRLAAPYHLSVGEVVVGASVGMASARSGETLEQVQRRADAALYEAKSSGRGTLVVGR
jgi:diguanylate cyclase (GGDEF)-like protein